MRSRPAALASAVLIACSACSSTREQVLDGLVVEAPDFDSAEPAVDGAAFELDPTTEPELTFTAWGFGNSEQHGTWSRYNVRVVQPTDALEDMHVSVVVDMDSVVTAYAALDRHLRTDDFFAVESHPTATFESTAVTADGPGRFIVAGDLTLRGTTRAIAFPATIEADGDRLASTATMEFSRWDFGLYPADASGPGDDGVDDKVILDYDVRLARLP